MKKFYKSSTKPQTTFHLTTRKAIGPFGKVGNIMEYTIPKIPTKAPVQITEKELIETLTIINVLSKELLEKVSRIPSEKSTSHGSGGKHYGNRNPYKKM